jgi:hypothetical protein
VTDRAQVLAGREQKLQEINPGGCHGYEYSADFRGLWSIFRSVFRCDLGLLVRGAAAGSTRPSRVKSARLRTACRSVGSMPADRLLRAIRVYMRKSRGFLRGFCCVRLSSICSVAIGADADANAGGADADAATLSIATAFDITLAPRSIAIRIMVLANDDAAFIALAPASA